MSARYSGIRKKIDSFKTYTGELDFTDEQSKTYLALQARRLKLEGEALLNASVDDALAMEKIEIAKEIMDIIEGEKL